MGRVYIANEGINAQVSIPKKNITEFKQQISSKQTTEIHKSFSKINSSLARAAKKGLIKKEFVSRKLSSLSDQINKN